MEATQLYDILSKSDVISSYLLTPSQLERDEFPIEDPTRPGTRKVPRRCSVLGYPGLNFKPRVGYTCFRCKRNYLVDKDGFPLEGQGPCLNHPGSVQTRLGSKYSCCMKGKNAPPCTTDLYHVHRGELELYNYTGFVKTQEKPHLEPNRHGVYALDAGFIYTTAGFEVGRVSVVDHTSAVVYDKLVKPTNRVVDCMPKMTGLEEYDLFNSYKSTSLRQVQADLLDMFSSKTIIIGHSVNYDINALKIFHGKFVDTSVLYPHPYGRKYGLAQLMRTQLGTTIMDNGMGDSIEGARAALQLVLHKINKGRGGDYRYSHY